MNNIFQNKTPILKNRTPIQHGEGLTFSSEMSQTLGDEQQFTNRNNFKNDFEIDRAMEVHSRNIYNSKRRTMSLTKHSYQLHNLQVMDNSTIDYETKLPSYFKILN